MSAIDKIARVVGLTLVDLLQDAVPRHRVELVTQSRVAAIARELARLTADDLLDLAQQHAELLVRVQRSRRLRGTLAPAPATRAAAPTNGGTRSRQPRTSAAAKRLLDE